MTTPNAAALSHRDRAVLRAVAAGRSKIAENANASLIIDGLCCSDQLAGLRLTRAGLIAPVGSPPGPVRLTAAGRALLEAA